MTWADTRDYCRQHFDGLASIHSPEQQELITTKCQAEMNDCPRPPGAVKHPARPYKSTIEIRFTQENAKGA